MDWSIFRATINDNLVAIVSLCISLCSAALSFLITYFKTRTKTLEKKLNKSTIESGLNVKLSDYYFLDSNGQKIFLDNAKIYKKE